MSSVCIYSDNNFEMRTEVEVGSGQEKIQPERNSHSKNRGGNNKLTISYLYLENI